MGLNQKDQTKHNTLLRLGMQSVKRVVPYIFSKSCLTIFRKFWIIREDFEQDENIFFKYEILS